MSYCYPYMLRICYAYISKARSSFIISSRLKNWGRQETWKSKVERFLSLLHCSSSRESFGWALKAKWVSIFIYFLSSEPQITLNHNSLRQRLASNRVGTQKGPSFDCTWHLGTRAAIVPRIERVLPGCAVRLWAGLLILSSLVAVIGTKDAVLKEGDIVCFIAQP